MSAVVNAIDNGDLYDSILAAGVKSPGVVTLSGHDRTIGWDIKKGPGTSGATTTRTSEDPVSFTASFYLVRDDALGIDDLERWPQFEQVLRSTVSGATPQAIDIYHPDLAANGITSVVLQKMGGAVHDGMGGVTYAVQLLEYRPPKAKGGTPSGSKAKKKTEPDPDADALKELERLTKQYEATPWS